MKKERKKRNLAQLKVAVAHIYFSFFEVSNKEFL